MQKKQKRKHSLLYKFLSALCVILTLVFSVFLAGTLYAHHLLGKLNYVEPQSTAPMLTDPTGLDAEPAEKEEGFLQELVKPKDDTIHILLIGQDRRPGEARARSDSMILCTVRRAEKSLTMTSIMRDLYVQIPGHGKNRVNAAYVFGGMELLDQTLEHNFGVHVDGNVEVDFSQFAKIIDTLGGVEMELRSDEASYINSVLARGSLTAGNMVLDGEQALTYARIRALDADADFSRTNRQRKVLNSLVLQFKDAGPVKLMGVLNALLPNITTDLSRTRILGYAMDILPILPGLTVTSQRIPVDGAYSGQMIDGMAVLVPDLEATRQFLQDTIGT